MEYIKTSEIKDLLESCWQVRDEVVPCLVGDPGIGKTQSVEEFARDKGADVVHIIASQILPNEVSGITMPVEKTHSMEVYDHARLASLKDGDILFFDELFEASPQVLSACLTLIQERRMMSGRKLPDVMIVAATNPLPTPSKVKLSVRQRFMFVGVDYEKDEWLTYMRERHGINVAMSILSCISTSDGSDPNYNVRTPRTMTKAALYVQANVRNITPLVRQFVESMVGETAANILIKSIQDMMTPERRAYRAIERVVQESGNDEAKNVMDEHNEFSQDVYTLANIYRQLSDIDPDIMEELAECLKDIEAGEEKTGEESEDICYTS